MTPPLDRGGVVSRDKDWEEKEKWKGSKYICLGKGARPGGG